MAITVHNLGGGDDWQSFFGQALGAYLGHRLNTIQTNRAQKEMEKAGYTASAAAPTDEDVSGRIAQDLANNGMDYIGMDARDALASRKKKWDEINADIMKNQEMLASLNGQQTPQAKQLAEQLGAHIANQQALQGRYHDQAEQIRKLGEQRGWNLAGYGANDPYQANTQQQQDYKLTYADMGLNEKELRDNARKTLENEREEQFLLNFDKDAYLAKADKASQKILTPYARDEFLAKKKEEAESIAARAKEYKYQRATQQLAGAMSPRNEAAAVALMNGLVDRGDILDLLKYQPKGQVIDNGNMNVVTYGGVRPQEYYGKGASPGELIGLEKAQLDNRTRLAITDKNNQTQMRNVDVQQAGANNRAQLASRDGRMKLDYGVAGDVISELRGKANEGKLTPEEAAQYKAANYMWNNSLAVGDDNTGNSPDANSVVEFARKMRERGVSDEEILRQVSEWGETQPSIIAAVGNFLANN